MRKLIVKSKSWCFDGLYFRGQLPNSIEWTSFDMAAAVFADEVEAAQAMERAGVCTWVTEVAPELPIRPIFTPSESTGFVRCGRHH